MAVLSKTSENQKVIVNLKKDIMKLDKFLVILDKMAERRKRNHEKTRVISTD